MIKQIISPSIGLALILGFGFLTFLEPQTTEAIEWWKPFKYEKWNCCPGFSPNMVTDSDYQQKLDTNNEQKIEINQICENVELCVIDLYNLNRQIVYGNTEYADK